MLYFYDFLLNSDNLEVNGLTVKEIAQVLGISETNVRVRLSKAGIKPVTKSPLYSPDAVELIRNVAPVGRPRKGKPAPDAAPDKGGE
jgi:hypothetical protein